MNGKVSLFVSLELWVMGIVGLLVCAKGVESDLQSGFQLIRTGVEGLD